MKLRLPRTGALLRPWRRAGRALALAAALAAVAGCDAQPGAGAALAQPAAASGAAQR
ncbi:TPA: cytochrome-c peroxidase, partial [Burkholderia multivorans]|nr:cytochrome-c peroxidase [Burkholderia multivorans]